VRMAREHPFTELVTPAPAPAATTAEELVRGGPPAAIPIPVTIQEAGREPAGP
jgi:hypothetical protein